jgi:hypothetical protein
VASKESKLEKIKVINTLLNWCHSDLFLFLEEVDARFGADNHPQRLPALYHGLFVLLHKVAS